MNCPYCEEPVNDGATVCKTCHRDFQLVLSLREAREELEQRVGELEAELAGLRADGAVDSGATAAEPEKPRPAIIDSLAICLLLPTVALIGAHYLLIIRFDARLAWLRAISIALPAVFGWMLEGRLHPRWFVILGFGAVVAIASVYGMSVMVHLSDGVPILPDSAVSWRESLEYVTSIALAYLLGSLIRNVAQAPSPSGRRTTGPIAGLASFVTLHMSGKVRGRSLEERIKRMVKLINLVASVATALGAVYTGFKGIL